MIETVKIKPSHPSQGEFVIINKSDFDPARHELLIYNTDTIKPAVKQRTRRLNR